jgi:hypothetical protein
MSTSWDDVCRALRFYRGDPDTGLDIVATERLLVPAVETLRPRTLPCSDLAFETARDHALDQARLGGFRGNTAGEARTWLSLMVHRRCIDALRRPVHVPVDGPDGKPIVDAGRGPERAVAVGQELARVKALIKRVLLAAGAKRRAIEVFLIHRLDPGRAERAIAATEYKDRQRGAEYFHSVLCSLHQRGDLDEGGLALGLAILSGTKMEGRPCPGDDE